MTNAISNKALEHDAQLCFIQVRQVCEENGSELCQLEARQQQSQPPELIALQQKSAIIFAYLEELPPLKGVFDHRIPLIEGATAVNIRPYRYPLK